MALPYPISAAQTDAKSPVDDILMDSIRLDLYDLDARLGTNTAFPYEWKVNGPISLLKPFPYRRIDQNHVVKSGLTVTKARVSLEMPGSSGNLKIDVRKYKTPNTLINAIIRQYTGAIQSITQIAPAHATQSIVRSTAQIATQSISLWKAAINIDSILKLDGAKTRINLQATPDADYLIGDFVAIAGASNAANNGTFEILEIKRDGGLNVVVSNSAGVDQAAAAGTLQLLAWSYSFTNPVSTEFAAGERALFAGHTSAANDGNLLIYAINQGGNNIIVKNQVGVAQAGIAGLVDVLRWTYTFLVAPNAAFVIGETAVMTSHTSAANDGTFFIRGIGAASITVYNEAGVLQGAAAGTVNTNRWIFGLPTDPSSSFSIGQTFRAYNTTSVVNEGIFTVVEINRSATNNLVAHNSVGTSQGAPAGTLDHTRMLYDFETDQSSVYSAAAPASRIEVFGCQYVKNDGVFDVLEVNRGGGANYNVVVDSPYGAEQVAMGGRIIVESRSIFNTPPILTLNTFNFNSTNRHLQFVEILSFSSAASFNANDQIGADVLEVPSGSPQGLVVQVS